MNHEQRKKALETVRNRSLTDEEIRRFREFPAQRGADNVVPLWYGTELDELNFGRPRTIQPDEEIEWTDDVLTTMNVSGTTRVAISNAFERVRFEIIEDFKEQISEHKRREERLEELMTDSHTIPSYESYSLPPLTFRSSDEYITYPPDDV